MVIERRHASRSGSALVLCDKSYGSDVSCARLVITQYFYLVHMTREDRSICVHPPQKIQDKDKENRGTLSVICAITCFGERAG